jgi:hypothetical protein
MLAAESLAYERWEMVLEESLPADTGKFWIFAKPDASLFAPPKNAVIVIARTYRNGRNVRLDTGFFGDAEGVLISPEARASADFLLQLPRQGAYEIAVKYAAQDARPFRLICNGQLVSEAVGAEPTGSWFMPSQRWMRIGRATLRAGDNVLTVTTDSVIPHIKAFAVYPAT